MCSKVYIIFASQTGQGEGISEEIFDSMNRRSTLAQLVPMDEAVEKEILKESTTVVFVTSSTGDGDPPDNAIKFFKKLRNTEDLSHLNYTLLGLGDSNYTTFLGFPKDLKKVLDEKGAKLFYEPGWADDAVGLETAVDPWIEGLWPALKNHLEGKKFESQESLKTVGASEVKHEHKKVNVSIRENGEHLKNLTDAKETAPVLLPSLESLTLTPSAVDEAPVSVEASSNILKPTLKFSPVLDDQTLKVPLLPRNKIEVKFLEDNVQAEFQPEHIKFLPSSAGPLVYLPVASARQLTSANAEKCAIELTLDKEAYRVDCEPGDSVGVICPNDHTEVEILLDRLGYKERGDNILDLVGEAKDIPAHFPPKVSLRCLLLYYCDIRSSPKKLLLRLMADFASVESEKRRLLELSSINGAAEYTQLVKEENISILDVLETFPSCQPPIDRILEHLPKQLPRAYSIVTSKLKHPNQLAFVYKIVEFPAGNGRTRSRRGVATGWMSQLTSPLWRDLDVEEKLAQLKIEPLKIPVYPRSNITFRLPQDLATPIVMVGPGTGVAPFLGFLHEREELIKQNPTASVGSSWLFFGCRHESRDFLYRTELERLHSSGVLTRFYTAFSREPADGPKYVQDIVKMHERPIVNLLLEKGAMFYVCGDAQGMAKDVLETVANAIARVKGVPVENARAIVFKLQLEKHYLQDVWN